MLRGLIITAFSLLFSYGIFAQADQEKHGVAVNIDYEGSLQNVTRSPGSHFFGLWNDGILPEIWKASEEDARYWVEIDVTTEELERCQYSGNNTLVREQIHVHAEIIDVVTNASVADRTIVGNLPANCPPDRGFNNRIERDYGTIEDPGLLHEWIRGVLESLPNLTNVSADNIMYGRLIAIDLSSLELATTGEGDGVRLYDLRAGMEIAQLGAESTDAYASFNGDGSLILTTTRRSPVVYVWNVSSEQIVTQLAHDADVDTAFFSPDSRFIVTTTVNPNGGDTAIYVWDATSGEQIAELGPTDYSTKAVMGPDGRYIVTITLSDNTMRVWDVESEERIVELSYDAALRGARFSPDGQFILVLTLNSSQGTSSFHIWDTESKEEIAWLGPEHADATATFSPDGSKLLTTGISVKVWNLESEEVIRELRREGGFRTASFSPDGSRILTLTPDAIVQVWDAESGEVIAEQEYTDDSVQTAAFSSDGQTVIVFCIRLIGAAGDSFTVIRTWNYATGEQTELALSE